MNAPFVRELRYAKGNTQRGLDVQAVQRALRNIKGQLDGYVDPTVSRNYGKLTADNVRRFRVDRDMKATGVYDLQVHRLLCEAENVQRGEDAVDSYCVWLFEEARRRRAENNDHEKVRRIAMYGYLRRDSIGYSMGPDRMQDFDPPPNVPNNTDCSAYVTWVYKSAGLPDPNGLGYNGQGYTGTLVVHGESVPSISYAQIGDLIFYGRNGAGDPTHVAIFVGNSMVVSHGSEGGPYFIRHDYRHDRYGIRRYF